MFLNPKLEQIAYALYEYIYILSISKPFIKGYLNRTYTRKYVRIYDMGQLHSNEYTTSNHQNPKNLSNRRHIFIYALTDPRSYTPTIFKIIDYTYCIKCKNTYRVLSTQK